MLLPCNLVALNQKVKVTPKASFKDPWLGHLLAGDSSYDDISCWRFASNFFKTVDVFFMGEEIPMTLLNASTLCAVYIKYSLFILYPYLCLDQMSLARNLVDTQPRYAYTTWAPKAKFCLQNQAAWNISRSRASPKRGSQGLGRCTLSPRIGSKPYPITGCGQSNLYWLLELFKTSLLRFKIFKSASALWETCLVFSTNWYLWVHPRLDSWRRNHQDTWVFLKHLGRNFLLRCRVIFAMCCWVEILGYCLKS